MLGITAMYVLFDRCAPQGRKKTQTSLLCLFCTATTIFHARLYANLCFAEAIFCMRPAASTHGLYAFIKTVSGLSLSFVYKKKKFPSLKGRNNAC
jgi:hypothetical protein